ncbi:hypothetical protein [Litoribacter populi]|uniref:hypothetical protein n=1 Tax=Litoribacter populi TaxID=2598460 RepID=UPI00117D273D|nr:hypothetical protein [Litoribacter populi]
MIRLVSYFLIFQILLSSCASGPRMVESDLPFQEECLQILIDDNQADYHLDFKGEIKPEWAAELDESIYRMAVVTNGVEELEQLVSYADKEKDEDYELALQRILRKVNVTSLEVSAIAGGLDCEEEKADQLADFLDKKVRKRERNLTVASIITGATASIVMGVILFAGGSDTKIELVGIAGGLTEVYLGLKILRMEKKTEVEHPNNVLRMIVDKDNSVGVFPSSVWYYFQSTPPEQEDTLRDKLLKRWEEYNDLPEDELEILFSSGGVYNVDMLKSRADLLDQLGAQITLMKQDLLKFNRYLLNL